MVGGELVGVLGWGLAGAFFVVRMRLAWGMGML